MRSYELLAIVLVLAIPLSGVALAAGAVTWARDAIDRRPLEGGLFVLATLLAAGNLLVERRCGGEVNRPLITAFVGPDGCRPGAMGALALVVLLSVATGLAVRRDQLRRWRPGGPAPARGDGGGSTVAR